MEKRRDKDDLRVSNDETNSEAATGGGCNSPGGMNLSTPTINPAVAEQKNGPNTTYNCYHKFYSKKKRT